MPPLFSKPSLPGELVDDLSKAKMRRMDVVVAYVPGSAYVSEVQCKRSKFSPESEPPVNKRILNCAMTDSKGATLLYKAWEDDADQARAYRFFVRMPFELLNSLLLWAFRGCQRAPLASPIRSHEREGCGTGTLVR